MVRSARVLALTGLLLAAGIAAASTTLYRWVDEQGRVHYSDTPQKGADEVEIGSPQTYRAPKPAPARPPASQPAPPATDTPPTGYDSVAITHPGQDQVLWNIGAVLTVTVRVQPALRDDHRLVVRYDGSEIEGWPRGASSHQVRNVFRGTHTLAVTVVDANGREIAAGEPVTFYVRQSSILY